MAKLDDWARRRGTVTMTPTSRLARYEALVEAYQRQVLAYAMRRSPTVDEAEDASAETFIIAWRKLDDIPIDASLPWLYAVARRVLANHRRGRTRRERLSARLRIEDVATPLRLGEGTDGPALTVLASLSPSDQELLRLVAWEELDHGAIAQVLGITPNAVAIRLHRVRGRFVAALKGSSMSRTSMVVKGTHGVAREGASE